jgi:23S rRNA pseudouridine2605 synthase
MMNKPRGVVTTARDEKGRRTVYSLLPEMQQWLAPVGRLDQASEGLLLLTNDSEWAARITAPESHVPKTYHVQITAPVDSALLASFVEGVKDDGELLRASEARVLRRGARNAWVEIVLHEGKNRQIRRMCSTLGLELKRLVRVAIGTLWLGDLQKGMVRELTSEELRALQPATRVRGSAR